MKFLRLSTATAETASPTRISPIPVQTLAHDSQRCSASWAKRIGGVALIGLSLSLLASGKAEAISLTFEKIVDVNTAIPEGTGNFGFFETPSLDNGNVAFNGLSGDFEQRGVYTNIGSELNVVADTNTPIPGGTGNFTAFGSFFSPSLDDGNVALNGFGGANFDRSGIYTSINGVLDVVADMNTPIPGGTGTFSDFFFPLPSLDNGNVAFASTNAGFEQDGIYTNIGGTLAEVIATGGFLDDKEVSSVFFGSEGLSGNQIAFGATFSDDSQAIYIATAIPEPSSVLGTLAFGAFGAGYMLKRREKKQKLASRDKTAV